MQEKQEKWLSEVFAMRVTLRPMRVEEAVVEDRFDIWKVRGLIVPFVLVTPKPGVANPSVDEIGHLVAHVSHLTFHWAAYGCGTLSAVERNRLLSRQVAFVAAGRQVFLPFLGIALRADSVALTRKWLGSVAQETVLAMLRGQLGRLFADRDLVRLTGCSRASAFRAFRELTTFGLVERIPGGYAFIPDVAQTLRLHMPRLRNSPIREALVAAAFGECV